MRSRHDLELRDLELVSDFDPQVDFCFDVVVSNSVPGLDLVHHDVRCRRDLELVSDLVPEVPREEPFEQTWKEQEANRPASSAEACLEDWSPGSFRDFLQDGADYGPTLFDMLPPHSDSWWLAS